MKLWALNVCVACILAGALDLFLPRQGSFKSIKTVLALYILVSVVTPAAGADWTGLASLSFETSVQPADYSDYVSGYVCQSLAVQTQARLAAAGIRPLENPEDSRKLMIGTNREDLRIVVLRATDVPTYVQYGAADLGVAGWDSLYEHGGNGLYVPVDLGIARCRMSVAAPRGFDWDTNVRRGSRADCKKNGTVCARLGNYYCDKHGVERHAKSADQVRRKKGGSGGGQNGAEIPACVGTCGESGHV